MLIYNLNFRIYFNTKYLNFNIQNYLKIVNLTEVDLINFIKSRVFVYNDLNIKKNKSFDFKIDMVFFM